MPEPQSVLAATPHTRVVKRYVIGSYFPNSGRLPGALLMVTAPASIKWIYFDVEYVDGGPNQVAAAYGDIPAKDQGLNKKWCFSAVEAGTTHDRIGKTFGKEVGTEWRHLRSLRHGERLVHIYVRHLNANEVDELTKPPPASSWCDSREGS